MTAPLSQIQHEARPNVDVDGDRQMWDVFISHASEDKAAVVTPLAERLRELGVTVWLDAFELKIGDGLRRKIDAGLAGSRFGIVVLSRSFFRKGWPQYELDGLVTLQASGKQNLLPIWHEISQDEVMAQSPSLADKIARSTAPFTIEEIATEIASVVRPTLPSPRHLRIGALSNRYPRVAELRHRESVPERGRGPARSPTTCAPTGVWQSCASTAAATPQSCD
jgi:hypothetical protein